MIIPIAVAWVIISLCVWYDARGRHWRGWSGPEFWGAMTFLFAIFAVPFYLLARARTHKL